MVESRPDVTAAETGEALSGGWPQIQSWRRRSKTIGPNVVSAAAQSSCVAVSVPVSARALVEDGTGMADGDGGASNGEGEGEEATLPITKDDGVDTPTSSFRSPSIDIDHKL